MPHQNNAKRKLLEIFKEFRKAKESISREGVKAAYTLEELGKRIFDMIKSNYILNYNNRFIKQNEINFTRLNLV